MLDKVRWDKRFKEARGKKYEVEFPDGSKAFARTLKPKKVKELKDKFFGIITRLSEAGMVTFILNNGTEIKGADVTAAPKPALAPALDGGGEPVKDAKGKPVMVPVLDEDGMPGVIPRSSTRVQLPDGDYREIKHGDKPTDLKEKCIPTNAEFIDSLLDLVWQNAEAFLKVAFPAQADRFTRSWIDENLDVPFMRALLDLVVELNELEFIVPFFKKMFMPEAATK